MPKNNETTTKFKVDISELQKAMQEAKRAVAVANSEFKAVSASMDDWTKSSDGLSAKLKQLDTTLSSQKTILKNLEDQYELTVKQFGEGSKAADDLKIKINNQKAAISKTEKEVDKYKDALTDVTQEQKDGAKAGKEIAEAVEEAGDSAKEAEGGFTVLKGAIATFAGNALTSLVGGIKDAIGSLIGLASETREYRTLMGQLDTAFTNAGFSAETAADTYKDLYAVLGDEGQATEASQHLAKLANTQEDLSKWTDIATGIYATFGSSLPIESMMEAANETAKNGQLTGALSDSLVWAGVNEEAFQASLDACTTEQERQALITETLSGLYDDAAKSYKKTNKTIMEAQRAQAELTDATAELGAVAEPVMTTFKLMGAELIKSVLPNVQDLGEGFNELINGVEGAEDKVGGAVSGLITQLLNKIVNALPQIANIGVKLVSSLLSALLNALPQITSVALTLVSNLAQALLNALPQLLTTLITMVNMIIESLGTILPEIVLAIVAIVPELITALLEQLPTFIEACITFLMAIVDALPTVIEAILAALPTLITALIEGLTAGIDALLQGAITLLMAIVDALPTIIDALILALPQILDAIIKGLLDAIPQLLEAAITLLMAIVDAIPDIVVALTDALPEIIDSITQTYLDNLPLMLETATTLLMAIVEAIPEIVLALGKEMPTIVSAIMEAIGQLLPKLGEFILDLMGKIGEWIVDVVQKGKEGAGNFVSGVMEKVKGLPSEVWKWLGYVSNKVVSWGTTVKTKAKEAAKLLWDGIVDTVTGLPDKIKEIGSNIVEGLWNGINNMASWIKEKIGGFGDSVLGALKDFFGINSPSKLMRDEVGKWIPEGIAVGIDKNAKSVLSSMRDMTAGVVGAARDGITSGGTVSGGLGGTTYNFYQTNNSPKSLSRYEIYRQSKNLLGLAGGM